MLVVDPETIRGVRDVVPTRGITVYAVIGDPPVVEGGVQLTVAWFTPPVAETPLGAPGMFCVLPLAA